MNLDDRKVADIVSRVVARLQERGVALAPAAARATGAVSNDCWNVSRARRSANNDAPIQRKTGSGYTPRSETSKPTAPPAPVAPQPVKAATAPGEGLYDDVDQACRAAERAFHEFQKMGFNSRFKLIEIFRKVALENIERWSHEAAAETKMGRAEDKIKKNHLVTTKTPGPEFLAQPSAYAGSDGTTLIRYDPWGVIASVIPCTNSTETVINNGIGMLAAGNSVVFNPHPLSKRVSADAVRTFNRAFKAAGYPAELLCCLIEPTIESANALMRHPITALVLVTGGGAVVDSAMKSGKRAICAGPGNPPAVVDETACPDHAAKCIVYGASLDNNVVCTDEKEVIAVESIADKLKQRMLHYGAVEVTGSNINKLTDLILAEKGGPSAHGAPNKKMVGKNPSHILREIGMNVDDRVRLALIDVDKDHPLVWTEQLMPVLPLCRVPDADAAIAHAVAVEAGRRHTASIHSQRIDCVTKYVNDINVSICVANQSNYAGLGLYGEGYTSFSISTPTGEGLTTARTFSRERRLAVCGGGLRRF